MDHNEVVSSHTRTQSCVLSNPKPQQVEIILQSFVNFLQKTNNVKESRSASVNSAPMMNYQHSSSSMVNYLSYRKNVNERMSEISNNVSQMIIESCTSIDNICNKVRECLTDMRFNTGKINSISEISNYGMNEVQSSYNMNDCMQLDKPNIKNNEDDSISRSEVSVIESVHDDLSQSVTLSQFDQRTLTPFFTIIQEGTTVTLQKSASKRQMLRAKNKLSLAKQMHKKTDILDAFKSALISNADMDEYEVMDKVVEDMNQEIAQASTTLAAIPYADSNPSLTEAILESEKTKLSESIAQLVPDVYRRPAVTDLHIKLLVQIEANDSYICFQRLMSRDCRGKLRRRKSQLRHLLMTEGQLPPALSAQKTISNSSSICSTSAPSAKDLKKKYADSLWFSDKQIVKKPHDKRSHKPKRHTGSSLGNVRRSKCQMVVNRPSSASGRIADRKKSKSLLSKSLLDSVINDAPPSPSTKYKMQCMRAKNMLSPNRHLGYLDILDDLTEKDLLPLQSEYPRRDNITEDLEIRDVEDTYLYKILHGKYNSKTTWSHLIEPQVECSDDNCQMCKRGLHPRPKNGVEELQTFNNEKFSKEQVINKLTPYLTDPETSTVASNHSQSVVAWPVLHDKKPLCHNRATEDLSKIQSAAQDKLPAVRDHNKLSKQQIAKKLLPYMTDPSNPAAASSHFRTVTVLPVHVTYDNHQVPVVQAEQPTKMASTMGAHTKLPLLPMKEPRMHTVRGNWTQPQQQSTGGPIHHQHRPMKKPLPAPAAALPNPPLPPPPAMNMSINLTTKVHSNSARCRNEKKLVTGLRQKTSRSFSPREKTSPKPQPPKKLNLPEKRLPRNSIYGKSVQQQLVNFVERQTEVYSVPRPKYAQPPMKNQTIIAAQASPTNQSVAKGVTPSAPPANTVPSPKNLPIPSTKNSPDKNDAIQSNIQKAINVIETKMVHILSTPGDSSSVEAFDDMEKNQAEKQGEKTVKKKTGTGNHPEKIEEEFATISDELFKKLDQILDSEMSKSSSIVTTEHTDKLEDEGSSRKGTGKNFLESGAAVKQETPAADSQKQSGSEDTNSKGDFADEANTTANSVYALENVNRSTTIESNKDVLDTEDIVSLNKITSEVDDLVASIGVPQAPTHIPEIPEEEPETTSKQIAEEILQNLLDAPYIKEIPKVLFEISNETPHIPEHDVPTPNHLTQEEPQLVSEQVDQTEIIAEHALPTPALKSETEKETADSFSDNVNKIIQRVEDIYSQLDDIQNTDVSSMDEPRIFCPEELSNVPRFKDESPRLPKIDSQEFLTPFMQAVKEKRTNYPESPKSIERSPSLYNVLTFLDTLTNIQIDKVGEEDKESQVVMCPLHKKVKLLKVSSDQFPPIDGQTRDEEKPKKAHKKEETKNGSEDHSKHHKIEVQKVIEAEYEDAKCQHHQVKIPVFHDLENNDETEPYEEAFNAKTSNEAPAVSKTVLQDDEASECKTEPYEEALSEQTSNETKEVFSKNVLKDNESSECKTTTTETSIEEKSTQVYRHIENASSKSCLESSDSSKASLDQPKVNIYIDNSDISIPKVISITDGAYGRETLLKIQDSKCGMVKPPSKVVVFREAIDVKGILRPIRNINQFKSSVVSKRNLLTLSTSNMVSGQGKMCKLGEENKTFLKSFYAIVYIIMFTALNMEYRCVLTLTTEVTQNHDTQNYEKRTQSEICVQPRALKHTVIFRRIPVKDDCTL
nr:unnamed protein product [Callosobruchus chinensis]